MFRGIKYNSGRTIKVHDISKDVFEPFEKGYYTEAFGNMDAYLDATFEPIIRTMYSSPEEQKVLNDILETKNKNLNKIFRDLLLKKGIITRRIYDDIELFKSFRNVVIHNVMPTSEIFKKRKDYEQWFQRIQNQEQFDEGSKKILKEGLEYGHNCWKILIGILNGLIKEKK